MNYPDSGVLCGLDTCSILHQRHQNHFHVPPGAPLIAECLLLKELNIQINKEIHRLSCLCRFNHCSPYFCTLPHFVFQIDLATFSTLTDSDLKELGITTFGARRKMLLAISGKFNTSHQQKNVVEGTRNKPSSSCLDIFPVTFPNRYGRQFPS